MKFLLGIMCGSVLMFIFYPTVVKSLASREDIFAYVKERTQTAIKEVAKQEVAKEVQASMPTKEEAKVVMIEGVKHILIGDQLIKLN